MHFQEATALVRIDRGDALIPFNPARKTKRLIHTSLEFNGW
jgi:hypothetical protein